MEIPLCKVTCRWFDSTPNLDRACMVQIHTRIKITYEGAVSNTSAFSPVFSWRSRRKHMKEFSSGFIVGSMVVIMFQLFTIIRLLS